MSLAKGAAVGAILAGGKSSRMGRDKSLIRLNGRTLIEHVVESLTTICAEVSIVADKAEEFQFLGLRVLPDRVQNAGPLGGIHAALSGIDAEEILVTGCDTPFLSPELWRHLLTASPHAPARVARGGDGVHPLCGVYRRGALPVIDRCIAARRFKLHDLLEELGASYVDITPDLPFYSPDLFLNINDPERLSQAEEWFRQ